MGKMRKTREILVGKPEGKRPFGRPSEDKSKMDLKERVKGRKVDSSGSG
jgi:hypothetical protein